MTGFTFFILIVLGIIALVIAFILFNFLNLWVRAWISGAPVGIGNLISMRLRGIPNSLIVNARITAVRRHQHLHRATRNPLPLRW